MLILYKNYKYDSDYNYIKTFNSKTEQNNFFNSLPKIVLDDTNYIKQHLFFHIDINFDELVSEGINYIMFNNGYKDIYAFILEKVYINEKVTRINYEIDVIQTYMFDFTLNNSFVERKVCTINEISDYDEGLTLGEHEIKDEKTLFSKDSTYFAMFNGFKEQQLIFDGNILKSVVDMPYSTSKPLTVIDGIQYPIYFMPLKETYSQAEYFDITGPIGPNADGGLTSKIFRFIKGYEGFAQYPGKFNGEDFLTGGYGITQKFQPTYFAQLGVAPYTEIQASEVLALMMVEQFTLKLYAKMKSDGLLDGEILNHKFDAFVSLAMNCGLTGCTNSTMYKKYIANVNDTTIGNDWLTYAITNENGEELQGLKDRRQAESNIFSNNQYQYRIIPTYDINGFINGQVQGNGYIPSICKGEV